MLEPEGRILAIRVPRGMPPHTTTDGVARIRVSKESKPLTGSGFGRARGVARTARPHCRGARRRVPLGTRPRPVPPSAPHHQRRGATPRSGGTRRRGSDECARSRPRRSRDPCRRTPARLEGLAGPPRPPPRSHLHPEQRHGRLRCSQRIAFARQGPAPVRTRRIPCKARSSDQERRRLRPVSPRSARKRRKSRLGRPDRAARSGAA